MNNKKFLIFRIVLIVLSILSLISIEYYQRRIINEEEKVIKEKKNNLNEDILIDAAKLYITNNQNFYSELLKNEDFEIRINTEDLVKANLISNNDGFKGYIKVYNDEFTFVNNDNMLIDRLDSKEYYSNSNNEKEAYDLKHIYKGKNPNNYIKYKEKTYRIVGITNTNDLKAISTENSVEENWGLSGDINYLKKDYELEDDGYKGIFYIGYVRSETKDINSIVKNEKRNNTYTVGIPKYVGSYSYTSLSDIVNASDNCKFDKITDISIDNCDSYLLNMLSNTYTSIPLENNMVYKINDNLEIVSSKIEKSFTIKKEIYISGFEEYKTGNGSLENPYEIK